MRTDFNITIGCLLFVTLLVPITVSGQVDDSLASYFPLAIGNQWNYYFCDWSGKVKDSVIRRIDEITDTVTLNESKYYILVRWINTSVPRPDTIRADSLGRIWEYGFGGDVLFFDFTRSDGGTYLYKDDYMVTVYHDFYIADMIGVDSVRYFWFDVPTATDSWYDYLFAPHLGPVFESAAWRNPVILQSAVIDGNIITSIRDQSVVTPGYRLFQNYPNPFNSSTRLIYTLPVSTSVSVRIFNILGQEIATLVNGSETAGLHNVVWDATNLPAGVYYYTMITENYTEIKRMLLVK